MYSKQKKFLALMASIVISVSAVNSLGLAAGPSDLQSNGKDSQQLGTSPDLVGKTINLKDTLWLSNLNYLVGKTAYDEAKKLNQDGKYYAHSGDTKIVKENDRIIIEGNSPKHRQIYHVYMDDVVLQNGLTIKNAYVYLHLRGKNVLHDDSGSGMMIQNSHILTHKDKDVEGSLESTGSLAGIMIEGNSELRICQGSIIAKGDTGIKSTDEQKGTLLLFDGTIIAEGKNSGINIENRDITNGVDVTIKGKNTGIEIPTFKIDGGEVTANGIKAAKFNMVSGKVILQGKNASMDILNSKIIGGEIIFPIEQTPKQ